MAISTIISIIVLVLVVVFIGVMSPALCRSMVAINRLSRSIDMITNDIDKKLDYDLVDLKHDEEKENGYFFNTHFFRQIEITSEKWYGNNKVPLVLAQVIASTNERDDGGNRKYVTAIKLYEKGKFVGWFNTKPMDKATIIREFTNIKQKDDSGRIDWDYLDGIDSYK